MGVELLAVDPTVGMAVPKKGGEGAGLVTGSVWGMMLYGFKVILLHNDMIFIPGVLRWPRCLDHQPTRTVFQLPMQTETKWAFFLGRSTAYHLRFW